MYTDPDGSRLGLRLFWYFEFTIQRFKNILAIGTLSEIIGFTTFRVRLTQTLVQLSLSDLRLFFLLEITNGLTVLTKITKAMPDLNRRTCSVMGSV